MPSPAIADLITRHITNGGLIHPGNPDTGQPPIAIPAPFRTTGMPDQQAKPINATAKLFGEALVHLIETHGNSDIIPSAELEQLRAAEHQPGEPVPITCRRCNEPIFAAVMINGRISIDTNALTSIKHRCHKAA